MSHTGYPEETNDCNTNEPNCSTSHTNKQHESIDELAADKPNYLNSIPTLIANKIINMLDFHDVVNLGSTCKQWDSWIVNAPQKYKPTLFTPSVTLIGEKLKWKTIVHGTEYGFERDIDKTFQYIQSIDADEIVYDTSDYDETTIEIDGMNKVFDFLIENEKAFVKKTLNIIDKFHTEVDDTKLSTILGLYPRLKLTELHEYLKPKFQEAILRCLDSVAVTVVYELDPGFYAKYALQVYGNKRPNFESFVCNLDLTDNEFSYLNFKTLQGRDEPFTITCRRRNFHLFLPRTASNFYLEFTRGKYALTTVDNYPDPRLNL